MENTDFKVNFLIVGTQKGGTTALANFLSQHPEICMAPCKETHFFDNYSFRTDACFEEINSQYQKSFPNYHKQQIIGEATPIYMYLPQVAPRIYQYNPEIKLIFLLRDPVQRAISHYNMQVSRGRESLQINLAFLAEKFRIWRDRNNFSNNSSIRYHSYISRGFYFQQIERIQTYFPLEQMLFIKTEDLWKKHAEVMMQIYKFLNIKELNIIPKQEIIFSSNKKIGLSEKRIQRMKNMYLKDIIALEKLLQWDLTDWK